MVSWLPQGFEFLSGLPEDKRRRRTLVVVQAFADDSGVFDGKSTVLAMAAFMGPAEDWAEFSDEWSYCLRQSPGIQYLKMAEASGLRGQFRRWSEQDRDEKLRGLLKVIDRHPRLVSWQSVELKAAKFLSDKGDQYANLYVGNFQRLIHDVCITLWDHGVREKFELIFDEQRIQAPKIRAWYEATKIVTKSMNPEAWTIYPTDVLFRSDKDYLPLQAADLWAWCVRHAQERGLTPERGSEHKFAWILGELQKLRMSPNSRHMTEQNFVEAWNTAQKIRQGPLPPGVEQHRQEYARAMPPPKKRKRQKPKRPK